MHRGMMAGLPIRRKQGLAQTLNAIFLVFLCVSDLSETTSELLYNIHKTYLVSILIFAS